MAIRNIFILSFFTLLCVFASFSSAYALSAKTDSLKQAIDNLRYNADYEQALVHADSLYTHLKNAPDVQVSDVDDAENLIKTLRIIAKLPKDARAEMAEADGLTPVILGHVGRNELTEGVTAASRQLEIRKRYLPAMHHEIAESLGYLTYLAWIRGDYNQAKGLAQDAIDISREALGDKHPITAGYISYLATILYELGKYEDALPLFREVLALYREIFGDESQQTMIVRNNFANTLLEIGDYTTAEPIFREVYAIRKRTLPEMHPDIALSAHNLAALLDARGEYAEAGPLFRESISINEQIFGGMNPNLPICLNNLAVSLTSQKRYNEADSLYDRVLTIQRKILGDKHPDVALSLQNRARIRQSMGNVEAAVQLYRKALDIHRKVYGLNHPRIAINEYNLANCLLEAGEYSEAETLFMRSLDTRIRTLGKEHPDVVLSLTGLAHLRRMQGEFASAESLLVRATGAFETARLRVSAGASRALFTSSPYKDLALVRLAVGDDAGAWRAAEKSVGRVLADLLLTSKQRSLTLYESAFEDSLRNSLLSLEQQLTAFREALKANEEADFDEKSKHTYILLLEAEASLSAFQKEIADRYPLSEGKPYELSRIQSALGDETAIVGWVDDYEGGADSLQESWAYIIRNKGSVDWVRCYTTRSNTELIYSGPALRRALATSPDPFSNETVTRELCKRLYTIRMSGVEPKLTGVRNLIIVPCDGMLGMPLESCIDREGRHFGDRYTIQYAPSATVYAWLHKQSTKHDKHISKNSTALLLGDPPFNDNHALDMARERAGSEHVSYTDKDTGSTAWTCDKDFAIAVRGGSREALSELPRLRGARREIISVKRFFSDRAEVMLGLDASEQLLVSKAGEMPGYDIIHIATHVVMDDERYGNCAIILSQVDLPDPLKAAERGDRIFDGRWTTEEILAEWSLNADLVVLSGCETALGRRVSGEGYLGFTQAFLRAGARSLLLSLWEVDDESTALLMDRFYTYLFDFETDSIGTRTPNDGSADDSSPVAEALGRAKIDVRMFTEDGKRHPYEHPYYWAGFILIGR